ncbi:MAG: efflux RND transporter periplasmic adaptor subunit [Desulfuromonadales bacterium]|nr:efflux RND transporter periplasmic adaptor subunit [Desulfuromonadales bacterium]
MRKKGVSTILVALALVAALAGGFLLGRSGDRAGHEPTATAGATTQYTCGMHPFIIQDEPGLCPICGMNLTPLKAGTGGQGGERQVTHWISPMDPSYVRDEPGQDYMGHDLVPVYADGGGSSITIDPVVTQNMGIRTEAVTRDDLSREIRTVGRIGFEESRQYTVNSKIGGWIERLHVNQTGQRVKKGEPLLEIYSPELVAAQEEYLLALRNRTELARSSFADIAAGGDRLAQAARQRLKYWDISERQIAQLEQAGKVSKTMTLYSPFNGIVSERKAFQGMNVMPGEELMQIADLSRVWVYADIYEYELPWVRQGQKVRVELPYAGDRPSLEGTIDFLYPTMEAQTRTARARIQLDNPGFDLKPDMFVNVSIAAESATDVLTIPADAVLHSGRGQHVFVALGEGRFDPRQIKTGLQGESGRTQVLEGLKEGEQVVTSAQFMLDSESKLREAIQKMTAPTPAAPAGHEGHDDDLEELFK